MQAIKLPWMWSSQVYLFIYYLFIRNFYSIVICINGYFENAYVMHQTMDCTHHFPVKSTCYTGRTDISRCNLTNLPPVCRFSLIVI